MDTMNLTLAPAGFALSTRTVQLKPKRRARSRVAVIVLVVAALFAQFIPAATVEKSPVGALLPDLATETLFAADAAACSFWNSCYWNPRATLNRGYSNSRAVGSYLWGGVKASVGGAAVGAGTGGLIGWGAGTRLGSRFGAVAQGASGGLSAGTGAAVGAVIGGVGGGVSYVWDSIF